MSEQQVKDAVQQNLDQDGVRSRKRRFGKKSQEPSPAPEPEPAPVPETFPSVYFSYYYEQENGDSGFSNIIIQKLVNIRSREEVQQVVAVIREQNPLYTNVQIISWQQLDR